MTDIRLSFIPEWAAQEYILLALPHEGTDWAYMLDEVYECYQGILKALTTHGVAVVLLTHSPAVAMEALGEDSLHGVTLVKMDFNDTWIRDYGPLSIAAVGAPESRLLADFGFNGWGLKFASNLDNLVTYRLYAQNEDGKPAADYLNCRAYELEGGAVETDGKGTLLTTTRCLCSPNRNGGLSKTQVEARLSTILGINRFLWLNHGYLAGDDTDSHVDTLARLCPNDTIIYCGPPRDEADEHYSELCAMREDLRAFRTEEGLAYSLVELPFPTPFYDKEDGHRLPATYANYLVTDGAVFVPAYGRPAEDELAARIIHSVYADREVVSVDCKALIRQHGSLHCATMQISK